MSRMSSAVAIPPEACKALPAAPHPRQMMQCMEVRGGNEPVDTAFSMPGVEAWVYSRPYHATGESDADVTGGGDVHYVSSCATGRVTRMLVADVSGHGTTVCDAAGGLRSLMRRFVNLHRPDPVRPRDEPPVRRDVRRRLLRDGRRDDLLRADEHARRLQRRPPPAAVVPGKARAVGIPGTPTRGERVDRRSGRIVAVDRAGGLQHPARHPEHDAIPAVRSDARAR